MDGWRVGGWVGRAVEVFASVNTITDPVLASPKSNTVARAM
jgi:hypothetical protein